MSGEWRRGGGDKKGGRVDRALVAHRRPALPCPPVFHFLSTLTCSATYADGLRVQMVGGRG